MRTVLSLKTCVSVHYLVQTSSQPWLTQTQEISPDAKVAHNSEDEEDDENAFAVINMSEKKWKKRKLNNGVNIFNHFKICNFIDTLQRAYKQGWKSWEVWPHLIQALNLNENKVMDMWRLRKSDFILLEMCNAWWTNKTYMLRVLETHRAIIYLWPLFW